MVKSVIVSELVKSFGKGQDAVSGVSLEVEAGTITTLLGPSGCGKTTTLRCIAGLETPSSGEILFGDNPVFSSIRQVNLPTEQRGIGMMFQSYALWPHMTVAENIAFGLKVRGYSHADVQERVKHSLDLVQLSSRADAVPGELSGGQQQRVALARSLAYDPDVLLLDEPLANLDARLREEMRFELLKVQERTGVTAIYVTHDQAEAMTFSKQIVVMQSGRIAQQGTPEDIYERPANRFVAQFVGLSNFIEVAGHSPRSDSYETQLGDLQSHATCSDVQYLMIRPEDIVVSDAPCDCANQIAANVVQRIYLGDSVTLLAEAAGTRLRVSLPRHHSATEGSKVTLTLPPERLIGLEG